MMCASSLPLNYLRCAPSPYEPPRHVSSLQVQLSLVLNRNEIPQDLYLSVLEDCIIGFDRVQALLV